MEMVLPEKQLTTQKESPTYLDKERSEDFTVDIALEKERAEGERVQGTKLVSGEVMTRSMVSDLQNFRVRSRGLPGRNH